MKADHTAGALPALQTLNAQTILTLQNGIGSEEILADCFGAGRVISGAITSSVEIAAPGRIEVVKRGGIGLAALTPDGRAATERALATLRSAGYDAREYADYRALKWSKALLKYAGQRYGGDLLYDRRARYADARLVALERRGFLETLAVMDALGIMPVSLPRYPVRLLAGAMRTCRRSCSTRCCAARSPAGAAASHLRCSLAWRRATRVPRVNFCMVRSRAPGLPPASIRQSTARCGKRCARLRAARWRGMYIAASPSG